MSSAFEPTGTATNLTRLEMEQVRKADAFANGKALTVGDSGLAPEGVVGVGSVNAEPYYSGPQASVDDLLSAAVPGSPGEGIGHTTFFPTTPTLGGGSTNTALAGPTWYGPTQIGSGTTGFASSATQWTDAAGQFVLGAPGYDVQVGDYLVVNKKVTAGTDLNDSCVATITNVTATVLTVDTINNPTNTGLETDLDSTVGDFYSYSIIRRGVAQLFAVPGSGPLGQEQTFLFVKPTSTLHANLSPSLAAINSDRLQNVVSPRRAGSPSVDRSDSVFESPAPRTGLDRLGYRVVFYPDDGTGNPDYSAPIASLNPLIDPAIPANDQRVTIDYAAGVVRFSCAPEIGGDIKVAGGTDATTGRLNLYATFFSYQAPVAVGAAKKLFHTRSTTETTNVAAEVTYDPTQTTWVLKNPLDIRVGGTGVGSQLRTMDVVDPTSLVLRANAGGVSVGDGTTSFGDFNGADAIAQALTFWATAATTSLRIHVKRGDYTVEDLVVPAGQELILEGDGRQDTRITLTPSGINAITVTSGGQLVLKDLALIQTTGGPVSVAGSIRTERTLFQGAQTLYLMGNAFRAAASGPRVFTAKMVDSEFDQSGRNISCIEFGNDAGIRSDFEYNNCTFEGPAGGQPLITVSVLVADPGLFQKVYFNKCRITLHGIGSASATAMLGPTGLLNLDPSLGGNNDIGIDDWVFQDCDVSVADEVIENKVLLHLLPIAYDAANVTVRMRVGKFTIRGGTWSVPGTQGSDFAPLFLMANHPVIENVTFLGCGTRFGTLGVTPQYRGNGYWTNAMKTALNDDTAMPNTPGREAAFSIAASGSGLIAESSGLTLRNVKFSRFHRASSSGELFLQGPDLTQQAINVDGVTVGDYNFGAAETDVPFTRLTIRPGGTGTSNRGTQGVFRNIHINLQPSALTQDWTNSCLVNLSTEGDLSCERVFVEGWVSSTTNSFQVGRIGIDINNAWNANNTVRGNVYLKNSKVLGMGIGIRVAGNPASYRIEDTDVLVNGDGTNDLSQAINVQPGVHPSSASYLRGNTLVHNNLPAASTAVLLRLNITTWLIFAPTIIANNSLYMSTGEADITANNHGIYLSSNDALSNINVILQGNSGWYTSVGQSNYLRAKLQKEVGDPLHPGPIGRGGGSNAKYVGAETGHALANATQYMYTPGENMVQNNLRLETP